jgi:hypothetical protein
MASEFESQVTSEFDELHTEWRTPRVHAFWVKVNASLERNSTEMWRVVD